MTNLIDNDYKYTVGDLIDAFKKAGLKISQSWVYRQERKGNLSLPKSTTNIKHPAGMYSGAVRTLTKEHIHQIVSEFLPGGSGVWHYKRGK